MTTIADLLEKKGHDVYSIRPDSTVYEAIAEMAQREIGALLVMEGEKLSGIISERDYARKIILEGKSSHETMVRDIMTSRVVSVRPERTVNECMAVMSDSKIRHLPVLKDDHLVGVVSIGDLVKAIIADQRFEIHQLHQYIGT